MPWLFCPTSVTESAAPATKRAATSSHSAGAQPTTMSPAAVSTVPMTATFAAPKRRMAAAAPSPATMAPIGKAMTTSPNWVWVRSSPDLIAGYRGSRLENSAPLVKNSAAVASRARLRRRDGAGGRAAGEEGMGPFREGSRGRRPTGAAGPLESTVGRRRSSPDGQPESLDELGPGECREHLAGQQELGVADPAADDDRAARRSRVDEQPPRGRQADGGDPPVLHARLLHRPVGRPEGGLAHVQQPTDGGVDVGAGRGADGGGRHPLLPGALAGDEHA